MRLKFPDVEIDPDDPWGTDRLECRKEEGENLTRLLSTIQHPFVMSISAEWGSGKTTFIRMWKQHLENQGFTCLYFNAWQNDFVSDPLVALVGEMTNSLDKIIIAEEKKREHIERLKGAGKVILRHGVPLLIKLVTMATLDVEKFGEEISDAFHDASESYFEKAFEKYEEEKDSLQAFRTELEDFARLVTSQEGKKSPLVFFVDELDRCRPTYAVELLERIKHLFEVDNIVFVLALSTGQLKSSIRSLYGEGIDATGYLRRFIDLDYPLREPAADVYSKVLFEDLGIGGDVDTPGFIDIVSTFGLLCDRFNTKLRGRQQNAVRLSLALRMTQALNKKMTAYLIFLVLLYTSERELFQGFRDRDKKVQGKILEIIVGIKKTPFYVRSPPMLSSYLPTLLEAAVQVYFMEDSERETSEEKVIDRLKTLDRRRSSEETTLDDFLKYWLMPQSSLPFLDAASAAVELAHDFRIDPS